MHLATFLKLKADEFEVLATREALKRGLISQDKQIKCRLIDGVGMPKEIVYPIIITDSHKSEILNGNWKPIFREILEMLIEKNDRPKSDFDFCNVTQVYQNLINKAFRGANKEFRIIHPEAGWDDDVLIHLGTIENNGAKPLGCIRYRLSERYEAVFG